MKENDIVVLVWDKHGKYDINWLKWDNIKLGERLEIEYIEKNKLKFKGKVLLHDKDRFRKL